MTQYSTAHESFRIFFPSKKRLDDIDAYNEFMFFSFPFFLSRFVFFINSPFVFCRIAFRFLAFFWFFSFFRFYLLLLLIFIY